MKTLHNVKLVTVTSRTNNFSTKFEKFAKNHEATIKIFMDLLKVTIMTLALIS